MCTIHFSLQLHDWKGLLIRKKENDQANILDHYEIKCDSIYVERNCLEFHEMVQNLFHKFCPHPRTQHLKIQLVSMGDKEEGQECADSGTMTPIGAMKLIYDIQSISPGIQRGY